MNEKLLARLEQNEKKLQQLRDKQKNLEVEIGRLERKIANQKATLSIVPRRTQESTTT